MLQNMRFHMLLHIIICHGESYDKKACMRKHHSMAYSHKFQHAFLAEQPAYLAKVTCDLGARLGVEVPTDGPSLVSLNG
jgi:hypothetical protein